MHVNHKLFNDTRPTKQPVFVSPQQRSQIPQRHKADDREITLTSEEQAVTTWESQCSALVLGLVACLIKPKSFCMRTWKVCPIIVVSLSRTSRKFTSLTDSSSERHLHPDTIKMSKRD
ncbi:hypothetical protein BaRGS_00029500 [Batillaria attramentaria]|uniref:Uncharacterized protein n=1 Tax=Batillaria attramentaria TaxID=370345 RepID=A0ABD0JX55_9CAEN